MFVHETINFALLNKNFTIRVVWPAHIRAIANSPMRAIKFMSLRPHSNL